MEKRSVETWERFESELADLRREVDAASNDSDLLFRGQEDSEWPLNTTLDRRRESRHPEPMKFIDYYRVIWRIRPQIESLTGGEWPIPEYPEVERAAREYDGFNLQMWAGPRPAYAYMAYLRHHGFSSPLLDWTRSPFVAAYFAFQKALPRSESGVSVFVLSKKANRLTGNRMPNLYRFGPYVKTHRRHVLQQSEYTLCLKFGCDNEWVFDRYDNVFDEGRHQQGVCRQFLIPASEKGKVLRKLDEHNLNAFSLFGSEEALMETFATREFDLG